MRSAKATSETTESEFLQRGFSAQVRDARIGMTEQLGKYIGAVDFGEKKKTRAGSMGLCVHP